MTPVADPFMADVKPTGLQRGRGGFLRSADDSPYVTDPTGEVCKTGDRKGQVKRLKYGSPSNRGREIENDASLVKWKQRMSFLGIGMDTALAEQCRDLVIMDADSEEFRHAADKIAVEADRLTRSWLAADRGTHGHLLCEEFDRGHDWIALLPRGHELGLTTDQQGEVTQAWSQLFYDNGLEILAIEASCVDDRWRLAGTLDRIVRTTRPLTFVKPSGELVTIPAGTVLILDIKFGKCRKAHPIQIASYAQSVPYDTETETRGVWPWPIDQTHALIAHGDFGDDVRPVSIELVWVDLVAGREHGGETVVQAKAWAARDDVFSVAQIVGEGDGTLVSPGHHHRPLPHTIVPAVATTPAPVAVEPVTEPTAGTWTGDPAIIAHCEKHGVFDEAEKVVAQLERLQLVDARQSLCATPDEGADWSDLEHHLLWSKLKELFDDLDPIARAWRAELASQAKRRGVDFLAQGGRTERRYHINKALIALLLAGESEDVMRELLAHIIGDVALFQGVEPGHALGSLGAAEAARFAAHIDAYLRPLPVA